MCSSRPDDLRFNDAIYNFGSGQWHEALRFADPIFGSTEAMVTSDSAMFDRWVNIGGYTP